MRVPELRSFAAKIFQTVETTRERCCTLTRARGTLRASKRNRFLELIGLLLPIVGFLIALWLIWVVLRWVAKKVAAAFRRK
jgi:hypothetical protein